jgi:hypothetical protein
LKVSAFITGGAGDIILNSGLIKQLDKDFGEIDVYADNPEVFELFHGRKLKGYSPQAAMADTEDMIQINSFGTVCDGLTRIGDYYRVFKPTSVLKDLISANHIFLRKFPQINEWLQVHPHKDGEAAEFLKDHGYKRHTLPAAMLGYRNIDVLNLRPEPLPYLNLGKYITLHNGIGMNHLGHVIRATKVWDIAHYNELIQMIKKEFPEYMIVQIGTPTGEPMKGVDFTFTGSLVDAMKVVAHASLHIDGETGLVHAARSFGVKSIVMFGPTPSYWFGYDENTNIDLKMECGPCWWSHNLWLKECRAEYKSPQCMNMIFPERVFEEVKKELAPGEGLEPPASVLTALCSTN